MHAIFVVGTWRWAVGQFDIVNCGNRYSIIVIDTVFVNAVWCRLMRSTLTRVQDERQILGPEIHQVRVCTPKSPQIVHQIRAPFEETHGSHL